MTEEVHLCTLMHVFVTPESLTRTVPSVAAANRLTSGAAVLCTVNSQQSFKNISGAKHPHCPPPLPPVLKPKLLTLINSFVSIMERLLGLRHCKVYR